MRHTASTITDPAIDALYLERDAIAEEYRHLVAERDRLARSVALLTGTLRYVLDVLSHVDETGGDA